MARKTTVSRAQFEVAYRRLKEAGSSDAAIARELGLSHMTVSRWKRTMSPVAAMAPPEEDTNRREPIERDATMPSPTERHARGRIAELERENEILKRLLADQLVQNAIARAKSGH